MPARKSYPPMKGQVFIEVIIAISLIAVLGLTVFRLTSLSSQLIGYTRSRVTARHLGTEKFEAIRNLAYQDICTQSIIPPGPLAQTENIEKNGINYVIKTSVIYIDDPYDELVPVDPDPADFK